MSLRQSWRSRRACRRRQRDLKKAVMELLTSSCHSEELQNSGLLHWGIEKSTRQLLHALVVDTKDLIRTTWKPSSSLPMAKEYWSEIRNNPWIAKGSKFKNNQYFNQCIQKYQIWQRSVQCVLHWCFYQPTVRYFSLKNNQSAISKYSSAKSNQVFSSTSRFEK